MPIFYRGAGVGTFWHSRNACELGFTAQSPEANPTLDRLMLHVARGTVTSPYISLTRSYGVAWHYAVNLGKGPATEDAPGFVYEVELEESNTLGLQLLDPVLEVANHCPEPLSRRSYQHDGPQEFLLGVLNPALKKHLTTPYIQPPPGTGTPRPPNLSMELECLIRTLRDAEILIVGNIPAACVRNRFPEFRPDTKRRRSHAGP